MIKPRVTRWTSIVATILALGTGLGVSACGSSSGGSSSGPIKIGALIPLTGPLSFFGTPFRDAINLKLKQMGGKIDGRPVQVIFEDETGDLATALQNARTLVQQDHVSMMIGPLNSGFMGGVLPFYIQNHIPVISLLNQSNAVQASGKGWLFTPQGSLQSVSEPGGLYAAQVLHLKTATTLGADYTAGRAVIGGFATGFTKGGGQVVQQQWAPLGTTDFSSYLTGLKNADVFVDWDAGSGDQSLISAYLGGTRLKHLAFGYGDALSETQVTALGPGMLGATAPMVYTWRLKNPTNAAFVAAYRQTYHRVPILEIDDGGYEAITVALTALQATKDNTSADALKKAILNESLTTPAGHVSFDPSTGFGIRNDYILKVERVGGKQLGWVPVATYKVSD